MTILDRIVRTKRAEVESARRARPLAELRRMIDGSAAPRDFAEAVSRRPAGTVALIAEIKRSSPSAGIIVADFDPLSIAGLYAAGGASALSVLTDDTFFGGHLDHLAAIKGNFPLPLLRKDFIIDEYQVYESRAAGADAILLISEILSLDDIDRFHAAARSLGMGVLVEGHSAEPLLAVLERLGPAREGGYLLGINNRDLHAQQTDVATTDRVAAALPAGTRFVCESGLRTRADVKRAAAAGACAILVGESLLRSGDIRAQISALMADLTA